MVLTICACKATDEFFHFQSSQKTFPQKQIQTTIFILLQKSDLNLTRQLGSNF